MNHLLLSPHNDDESLFASYVCLRHRPRVLVVFDGGYRAHFATPEERAAESAAAMEILGCEFEHLGFPVDCRDWDAIGDRVAQQGQPDHVWAPLPEPGGHRHHNRLGELAVRLWPGRVSFYTTYQMDEGGYPVRSVAGDPVPIEDGWSELKRQALDCYVSQINGKGTRMHFERPLDEYIVPTLRLNLGGYHNPIPGFVNLDREWGWRFEDGLADWPDGSVEAVTESHALMYVPRQYWPMVFAEIARVLEPGGTVRMTHDNIGGKGSTRPRIRPGAALATTPNLFLHHLSEAGLAAGIVGENETGFRDRSLIQQNYGHEPDVFHVEAVKPSLFTGKPLIRQSRYAEAAA